MQDVINTENMYLFAIPSLLGFISCVIFTFTSGCFDLYQNIKKVIKKETSQSTQKVKKSKFTLNRLLLGLIFIEIITNAIVAISDISDLISAVSPQTQLNTVTISIIEICSTFILSVIALTSFIQKISKYKKAKRSNREETSDAKKESLYTPILISGLAFIGFYLSFVGQMISIFTNINEISEFTDSTKIPQIVNYNFGGIMCITGITLLVISLFITVVSVTKKCYISFNGEKTPSTLPEIIEPQNEIQCIDDDNKCYEENREIQPVKQIDLSENSTIEVKDLVLSLY